MIQIDGLILTDPFANTTLLLFKVKTALVDIGDQGDGLGEEYVDGLILRYLLIELIGVFDRAVFDTGRTARAFALPDISGLLRQGYLEITRFPCDTVNFGIRQDLYIGMPADLDQFGREYSDGAVVGREGLVKLGHMAANGRRFVDQVDLEARRRKVQTGLNPADPSADNHHISKVTALEAFANTVRETLTNLVLNFF